DRIGAVFPPPHPAPLRTLAHHRLTPALHRARTDLPTLRHVRRVVHPIHLVLEIPHHAAMALPRRRTPAAQVHPAQLPPHRRTPPPLQPPAPARPLRLRRRRVLGVPRLGQVPQVLRHVVEVQDHRLHTREVGPQEVLQPAPPVRHRHPPVRLA